MKTIQFTAIEFPNVNAAIQYADASGRGEVITLGRRFFVVDRAEAERLAAAGVCFAYVGVHEMADGTERLITIPVN